MTRENCEPWGYVAPVVAANDVAALVRRATHLLNLIIGSIFGWYLHQTARMRQITMYQSFNFCTSDSLSRQSCIC